MQRKQARLQVQKTYNLSGKMWRGADAENPYWMLDTVEMKTAWHPIGL